MRPTPKTTTVAESLAKSAATTAAALLLTMLTAFTPAFGQPIDFEPVRKLLRLSVDEGVFPGASVAVLHRDSLLFNEAFGTLRCRGRQRAADTSSVWDVASLTKPVVTASIAMQLIERDSLRLDDKVADYLPAFAANGKEEVTIRHLLTHTSGLRPHNEFADSCSTAEQVIAAIAADTLRTRPGKATAYSDNGFIILGHIIEQLTASSLDANFRQRFADPLGMRSSTFNPDRAMRKRIASTGRDHEWPFRRRRPLVNDRNAALMGGVAGHAGLFSTTGDLARFIRMLMAEGELDGVVYFKPSTVRRFTKRSGDAERALGWDLRAPEADKASAGPFFSENSWGHLGFTGTSIWVDPEHELAVIVLTNRVCPTPENKRIRIFRPLLHSTVARCFGFEAEK